MEQKTLFWSRRGRVACERHAPPRSASQWTDEGWQAIPAVGRRRIKYQCEFCGNGAIQHQDRASQTPLILNVDDRPENLYIRDRILRLHGFTVANADTGRSALDVARQLRPKLILLDIHLPDIDGRQLCRQVKADEELSHIPVLLISATLRVAGELDTVRHGFAEGFIAEPVEPEVLAGTIRRVLGVG